MVSTWQTVLALAGDWWVLHGTRILVTLLGTWIALRFLRGLVDWIDARLRDQTPGLLPIDTQQTRTLAAITQHAGTAGILFVAGLVIASELGFNPTALLASAGIVGVALGFGAQSLVKDLLAGCFVLFEKQFVVGDWIRSGTHVGEVESITLRATCLRDFDGSYHIIPNGDLGRVSNLSKGYAKALVDVRVAYHEDLDRCLQLLGEIGASLAVDWPERVLTTPDVLGVDGFAESGVTLRLSARTAPAAQWDVARELRRRIKNGFEAAGIVLPYPQHTVWLHGAAPPVGRV